MPAHKLTSEQRLSRSIDIMEALYAAGEKGMGREEICSRFNISGAALDEIIEIISTLADRESGARIICTCHTSSNRSESNLELPRGFAAPSCPKNWVTTNMFMTP